MAKDTGIRSDYKPTDDEELDLRFIYERKTDMGTARADYEKEWDEADKQYEMLKEERDNDDWQSNINVPTTTAVVESQLAEMVDQYAKPIYLPRGVEDKPRAIVMTAINDYAWEVGRTDLEIYIGSKDGLVRGTGILQDYYRKESRMVQMPKSKDSPDSTDKYTTKEMVTYDDLFAESVKLEDFYVDEQARSFSGSYEAKDCIRRYIMHMDDFNNFFKGSVWDPMNNAQYVKPGGDTNYYEYYKPPEDIKKNDVEVLWYWGMRPTPGRPDVSDHLMIVANDVMMKRGPNPYNHKRLPFVRIVDVLKSHRFYGTGEAKLLESIQEEQTTLRRMVIDRNHLDIDKSFLVSNRETDLDEEDIMARPHLLIPVEDVNNIKPVEYGDIPRSVFQSLAMLGDDAIRVTGYDDRLLMPGSATTATQAAIMKEATLKRLRNKIWLLLNESIYQMGLLRESNIRQYYTVPKVQRIIGDKASADYKRTVKDAYENGTLVLKNGQPYQKKYRNIRMTNKKLVVDQNKNVISVQNSKEPTFFEALPDMITPVWGQYDVKIVATPTLPVSKPLMQEKASQMFDRLIQLPIYDPMKLGDALLEANDYDPDEFKKDQPIQEQMNQNLIPQQVNLAQVENGEIMKGSQIPPTPMATEPHTEIHIAFINSPQMSQEPANSPKLATLTRHIAGEIQEQQQRASAVPGAMGGPPGAPPGGPPGYKPPSGPTAPNMTPSQQPVSQGNMAMPAIGQMQQGANGMGAAMSGGGQ